VIVILLIEVRADGSVGDVDVKASGGDAQTDAAAVAYVRKLRWKPAVKKGTATTMKVLFSVSAHQGT
jgi:TonB family protein